MMSETKKFLKSHHLTKAGPAEHGTVVFWGSINRLKIFAQNLGFVVSKLHKIMNSKD